MAPMIFSARFVPATLIALGALTAIACGSGSGSGTTTGTPPAVVTTSHSPSPSSSPTPSPVMLTMPNLVGQNAAVAEDQLKKLGFTSIQLGTVDGHAFIALPANWTVKTQSAKAGAQIRSDTLIVLGCAKNI
jgi:hypothetical protein